MRFHFLRGPEKAGGDRWCYATIAASSYALMIFTLCVLLYGWTDRLWPVTLIAFGPRWLLLLPLFPVALIAIGSPPPTRWVLCALTSITIVVMLVGVLDLRLGLSRSRETPTLRVMTANVGEGHVTAEALNRLLVAEGVDLAALQECPLDGEKLRAGWQFFSSGDLCLLSRYPFRVLEQHPGVAEARLSSRRGVCF